MRPAISNLSREVEAHVDKEPGHRHDRSQRLESIHMQMAIHTAFILDHEDEDEVGTQASVTVPISAMRHARVAEGIHTPGSQCNAAANAQRRVCFQRLLLPRGLDIPRQTTQLQPGIKAVQNPAGSAAQPPPPDSSVLLLKLRHALSCTIWSTGHFM